MNIGILGALGIVFVVLKLVGVISWAWWLVLLPFYGGFFVLLLFAIWMLALAMNGERRW